MDMVKDDWPSPRYCRAETAHLKFFYSSDSTWTWWKMIDASQILQTTISPEIFLNSDLAWTWERWLNSTSGTADQNTHLTLFLHFRFNLAHSKRWLTSTHVLQNRSSSNFFTKFRYDLDMVKDDWFTPRYCRLECHLIFVSLDLAWTC